MNKRETLLRRRIELAEANLIDSVEKLSRSKEVGILLDIDEDDIQRQRETLHRLKQEESVL